MSDGHYTRRQYGDLGAERADVSTGSTSASRSDGAASEDADGRERAGEGGSERRVVDAD